MSNPSKVHPANPFSDYKLSPDQATAYLKRINLPASRLLKAPSLALLSEIQLKQVENIPKDTSPLHVPVTHWGEPSQSITLGSSFTGMPFGATAYERIVLENKGAYCFSINATLAAFLRAFGFRVSEMVTRCYKQHGQDPTKHEQGYLWGTFTHQILIVDWEGSDERYLVDGAWGPWNQTAPIPVKDGAVVYGLNSYEAWVLKNEDLPLSPWMPKPIDQIKGWTLYRWITPEGVKIQRPITKDSPGYLSPLFHWVMQSVPLLDFRLYHHLSSTHDELASFTYFWLITKVIPNSGGARRSMMYADKEGMPRRCKVYTTGGEESNGSQEGRDVEWVDMETGPMKEYLAKEFGYKF